MIRIGLEALGTPEPSMKTTNVTSDEITEPEMQVCSEPEVPVCGLPEVENFAQPSLDDSYNFDVDTPLQDENNLDEMMILQCATSEQPEVAEPIPETAEVTLEMAAAELLTGRAEELATLQTVVEDLMVSDDEQTAVVSSSTSDIVAEPEAEMGLDEIEASNVNETGAETSGVSIESQTSKVAGVKRTWPHQLYTDVLEAPADEENSGVVNEGLEVAVSDETVLTVMIENLTRKPWNRKLIPFEMPASSDDEEICDENLVTPQSPRNKMAAVKDKVSRRINHIISNPVFIDRCAESVTRRLISGVDDRPDGPCQMCDLPEGPCKDCEQLYVNCYLKKEIKLSTNRTLSELGVPRLIPLEKARDCGSDPRHQRSRKHKKSATAAMVTSSATSEAVDAKDTSGDVTSSETAVVNSTIDANVQSTSSTRYVLKSAGIRLKPRTELLKQN
jgi:hypothetical protein